MRRYYAEGWNLKKLAVQVPVPDTLDLSALRSLGPVEGEQMLPEDEPVAAQPAAAGPQPDEAIVASLIGMGFSENGSKRAALATNNSSAEVQPPHTPRL